jgi:hypothetical protein
LTVRQQKNIICKPTIFLRTIIVSTQQLDMPTLASMGRYYNNGASESHQRLLQWQYDRIVRSVGPIVVWLVNNNSEYSVNGHQLLHQAPAATMPHGKPENGLLLVRCEMAANIRGNLCRRTAGVFVGTSIFHRIDNFSPDGSGEAYVDMLPGGRVCGLDPVQTNTLTQGIEEVVPVMERFDFLQLPIHEGV